MAIQSASARLNTGIRCWCVDKNITANLTSTVGVFARGIRIYRFISDLELTPSIVLTDERYKTYGGRSVMSTTSSFSCKFPTYIRIDVEKLQLPEGVTCTIEFEEGWVTEGDYPGSTFAPSPEIKNFFTFRTPWYGLSFMNSLTTFNLQSLRSRIRFGQIGTNSETQMVVKGIFNPGQFAALLMDLFRLNSIIGNKKPLSASLSALSTVTSLIGNKKQYAADIFSQFNINNAIMGYLKFGDISASAITAMTPSSATARIRFGAGSFQNIVDFSGSARRFRDTPTVCIAESSIQTITPGTTYSWGENNTGQLGIGTTVDNPTPSRIFVGVDIKDVSAGTDHSVALTKTGELWVWGNSTLVPTRLGSATNWTKISAGLDYTLAINSLGELWAWGSNVNGRTGLGTTTGTTFNPTQVGSATNWTQIAAGETHSLALNSAGELWAWGSNIGTGLGSASGNTTTPTRVGSATDWSSIAAGLNCSVALKTSGQLWAWGENANGVTGQGTDIGNTLVPTRIGTATNWSKITCSSGHANAITTTGQLWGWGDSSSGARTSLSDPAITTTPTRIGTASNWNNLYTGNFHAFATNTDNELWGWGTNGKGEVNYTISSFILQPSFVSRLNYQLISGGNEFTLAISN